MSEAKLIVQTYLSKNYPIVTWAQIGDKKGPTEAGWPTKKYTLDDYNDGNRVGIVTGTEISEGKFLCDVDIDFGDGQRIASRLLPHSDFVFGRESKHTSHVFYTTPEAIKSEKYEDVDKTTLIELRGVKTNGDIGFQTMVPPSIWTKAGAKEPLEFRKSGEPTHVDSAEDLKQSVCHAAIGMMIARNLGKNGFGHLPRLAWAGFLLRLSIPSKELIQMGLGISEYCNNLELKDVEDVVNSTRDRLTDPKLKIAGGPALAKFLGPNGKAIVTRITEWLGKESGFKRNKDGIILPNDQFNIKRAIDLCEVELSYNLFSDRLFYTGADKKAYELNDALVDDLWWRIDKEHGFRPTQKVFQSLVENLARANKFHPVREYLDSLKWDGIPRINHWLHTYCKAKDGPYEQAICSIFMIAAVRRIRQPGCKFDEMVILESKEGFEKSTAVATLCTNPDWFTDGLDLSMDSKRIIELTAGKWIVEAGDLSGQRKADRDHLKSLLSRQVDGPVRMAYAHYSIERPRQFVIVGTTNNQEYLNSPTGARRFWPVGVNYFDIQGLVRDRDQLWAEASFRESQGESIRLPKHLWALAGEEQEARREVDAWEDTIKDIIKHTQPVLPGITRIPTVVIWDALQIDEADRNAMQSRRISAIMQIYGFSGKSVWHEGKTVRGYEKKDSYTGELFEEPNASTAEVGPEQT